MCSLYTNASFLALPSAEDLLLCMLGVPSLRDTML